MEIHWVGLSDLEDSERERVEERLTRLAASNRDLIDIRITHRPTRHHNHGGQEIRITCDARGHEFVVARTRPDRGLALHEALEAFERQVRDVRAKRRDQRVVVAPRPPLLGIVDRLFKDEGYGFILSDNGESVYFHRNAVKEGLEFDGLQEADRVALNCEAGRDGLQATVVFAPPPGES